MNLDIGHLLRFEVSHANQCLRFEDFRKHAVKNCLRVFFEITIPAASLATPTTRWNGKAKKTMNSGCHGVCAVSYLMPAEPWLSGLVLRMASGLNVSLHPKYRDGR